MLRCVLILTILFNPCFFSAISHASEEDYRMEVTYHPRHGHKEYVTKYDKETGKKISKERYYSNGKIWTKREFDSKTGKSVSYEKYYKKSGELRKKSTYDPDTGKKVSFEAYSPEGEFRSKSIFDKKSGKRLETRYEE